MFFHKYFVKKLFYVGLIFLIVAILIFSAMKFFSDPVISLLGYKSTFQQREQLRIQLGLDKTFLEQFWSYISNIIFKWDFGQSYAYPQMSALSLFMKSFKITFTITCLSCLIASLIGIFLGYLAAINFKSKIDYILIFTSILFISMPSFIIGFLLQYFLAFYLNLLPISGLDQIKSWILPITSLSLVAVFSIFRIARVTLISVSEQPFVIAARAKGLSNKRIWFKHILKNSLVPILTHVSLIFNFMLSGAIVLESIFNLNGLGLLMFNSFNQRDLPVLQCCVIILSLVISLIGILVELLCYFIDPTFTKK
ncbi:ABC transporter permease [Candidatus Phytoplasma gossypii]|uniref:ABC transporter permease n=1 Tax=Candidatus Phytoplasma gossypii TaxID=2982629 RepID=A0ABT9D1Z9_9MOLU|nr:ABC transporter permease ['Gossypium sp.' phytoplasma]MDO8057259.1 ABC transporter permease ['Gossypium sp.' phytoplasma]